MGMSATVSVEPVHRISTLVVSCYHHDRHLKAYRILLLRPYVYGVRQIAGLWQGDAQYI